MPILLEDLPRLQHAHALDKAALDGANAVLKTLADAQQLSPLQMQAFHAAMKPLKEAEAASWKAYMGGFRHVGVVAEVQVVTPTALATA